MEATASNSRPPAQGRCGDTGVDPVQAAMMVRYPGSVAKGRAGGLFSLATRRWQDGPSTAWVCSWHQEGSSTRSGRQRWDRQQGGGGVPVPGRFRLDEATSHLTRADDSPGVGSRLGQRPFQPAL